MDLQGRAFPEHIALKRGRFVTAIRVEPRVYSRPYAFCIGTGVFCLPKCNGFPTFNLLKEPFK